MSVHREKREEWRGEIAAFYFFTTPQSIKYVLFLLNAYVAVEPAPSAVSAIYWRGLL